MHMYEEASGAPDLAADREALGWAGSRERRQVIMHTRHKRHAHGSAHNARTKDVSCLSIMNFVCDLAASTIAPADFWDARSQEA
jgi:hypothetical protein